MGAPPAAGSAGRAVLIAAFGGVAVALLQGRRPPRRPAGGPAGPPERPPCPAPASTGSRTRRPPAPPPVRHRRRPPPADDEGPPVVLKGNGIGAFLFGADPDQVIAGLTLRWGPPDGDTGWIAAGSSPYGACPGRVVRGVNWRGFTVLFSDGATPRGQAGTRHFFTWVYQVDDPARPAPDPGGNRPPLGPPPACPSGPRSGVPGARTARPWNCSTSRPAARSSGSRPPRAACSAR